MNRLIDEHKDSAKISTSTSAEDGVKNQIFNKNENLVTSANLATNISNAYEAINKAVSILSTWGFINLGVWFFLGAEERQWFNENGIQSSVSAALLLYGGLVIGIIMLCFAVYGFFVRAKSTIILSSLSLFLVGIFNIASPFLIAMVMKSAGFKPANYGLSAWDYVWVLLGVSQVKWGWTEFSVWFELAEDDKCHNSSCDDSKKK